MTDEYAYNDANGKWVAGFDSRASAIVAGLSDGRKTVKTARVELDCPSYFARFEAQTILARMITGLKNGEEIGKVIGGASAIRMIGKIETADVDLLGTHGPEYDLQIDLMNRLQSTVSAWINENQIEFEPPKFVAYMSEELHIAGPDMNISLY